MFRETSIGVLPLFEMSISLSVKASTLANGFCFKNLQELFGKLKGDGLQNTSDGLQPKSFNDLYVLL